MKDLSQVQYDPTSEKLTKILCKKTQNDDPLFFRILVAYYLTKITSMMRVSIDTKDRGVLPINMYAINLASSGKGKGLSTNIIEEQVIDKFRERFLNTVFPAVSTKHLEQLAGKRAIRKATEYEDELTAVEKEFNQLGSLAFSFDSGTTAAVKQMRHKLLMANAGSMNMEIDEIGSNLLGNMDVLTTFLELFDIGKVKQKLTKNTNDNVRSEEIEGRTPSNMMLFGTPSKLLNGGKTEDEFFAMLEAGYARRCFFGFVQTISGKTKKRKRSAQEVYDMLTDTSSEVYLLDLAEELAKLATSANFGKKLIMSKDVSLISIEYRLLCEDRADELGDHDDIRKAELIHRYFKALKLAGTYTYITGVPEITEDCLYAAIKLTEDSGEAFSKLLTRERNYVKLARYIATVGREVTHVDLIEELPFYKGTEGQKRELMLLATAYGYKNNIIIKRSFNDGIEFLTGESLNETNLDEVTFAYSDEITVNYKNQAAPFDKLYKLMLLQDHHWINHHVSDGYRDDEHIATGFNLLVLDVDDGTPIVTAELLLKDYTYLLHTTKRHTVKQNRYRIILPLSHELKMSTEDYKEYMANVYEWLPLNVDTSTCDRARKWATHSGTHKYNYGKLIDALPFIPKTTKNSERRQYIIDTQSLSNLERWFINKTDTGNRSNQLVKYALMLVDSGMDSASIQNNVLALNNKLQDRLEESEILSTIMMTVAKAIIKRDSV